MDWRHTYRECGALAGTHRIDSSAGARDNRSGAEQRPASDPSFRRVHGGAGRDSGTGLSDSADRFVLLLARANHAGIVGPGLGLGFGTRRNEDQSAPADRLAHSAFAFGPRIEFAGQRATHRRRLRHGRRSDVAASADDGRDWRNFLRRSLGVDRFVAARHTFGPGHHNGSPAAWNLDWHRHHFRRQPHGGLSYSGAPTGHHPAHPDSADFQRPGRCAARRAGSAAAAGIGRTGNPTGPPPIPGPYFKACST